MDLSTVIQTRRRRRATTAATATTDEDRVRAAFDRVSPFTVGVEEEYLLVDPDTLDPAPVSHQATARPGDGIRLAPEFRAAQVEAVTTPCATVAEVERQLAAARRAAAAAVDGTALLVASGTHPTALDPGPVTPLPRYLQLAEAHPWAAQHALTCGLHVHVAVSGAERALAVHDALRSYLPEIVALSANAPYYRGGDSGLATVRPKLNTCWPRFGIPPAFRRWSELVALDRWARESGAYADESYQWWDLRLRSELGTLEIRAADVPTTVEETATITAFVQTLVYDLACRYDAGEALAVHPHERINENLWLATRDGLAGRLIDLDSGENSWTTDRLLHLAQKLLPAAAALGCDSELRDVARIVRDGGGAGRQRKLAERAGTAGLVWSLAEQTQEPRPGRSGATADLFSP